MVGSGDVFRDLIETIVVAVADRIFTSVDGTLLQSGELIACCHSYRHSSECGECSLMILIFHGTDGYTLKVIDAFDGIFGEYITETGFHIANYMEALFFCCCLDQIANRSVYCCVSFFSTLPQISLIQNGHLRNEVGQNGVCCSGDVQVVHHGQFQHITLTAQCAASHNVNLDLSVGGLLNCFCYSVSALYIG